jgi:hypothetical protein
MNFNLHGEVLLRGIKTGNYVNHQHNSSQEPAIEMRQYLFYRPGFHLVEQFWRRLKCERVNGRQQRLNDT